MKRIQPIPVSIGVVAYNEEATIASVLRQILDQKRKDWLLKEILVYCDGCTDQSEEEAQSVKGSYVKIIAYPTRRGKTFRLSQMFRQCTGDFLVMFDADITLNGKGVVTKLIAPLLSDKRVMLVGGNSRPYPPKTFIERAVSSTFDVFDRSRRELRGGHNIFGCTGSILAIRQSFAKTVQFPPIVNEDAYLYLLCRNHGHQFRYVSAAVVQYKLPSRWGDYLRQVFRSNPEGVIAELTPHFGDLVTREFLRPFSFYARCVLFAFLKNPLGVSIIALLNIVSIIFKPIYPIFWRYYDLRWFTAASTK